MTDSEVLQKAIERAVHNGWEMKDLEIYAIPEEANIILFDHSFCEALFTVETPSYKRSIAKGIPSRGSIKTSFYGDIDSHGYHLGITTTLWRYHLTLMTLSEDRIDYLRNYLEEK